MRSDEFHQNAAERVRHVNDEPIFVSADIKYDPVVGNEIDRCAECPLYVCRALPPRSVDDSKPSSNWTFSLRVALPEHPWSAASDHLHAVI
jgi:hypothetical protein